MKFLFNALIVAACLVVLAPLVIGFAVVVGLIFTFLGV